MSSRFNEHGLKVMHKCSDGVVSKDSADDLFYDVMQGHPEEKKQLQCIRDSHSKHKKDKIGGKIITCEKCGELFTPNDIVNMSMEYHMTSSNDMSHILPLHHKRVELAAYRHPYDYEFMTDSVGSGDVWNNHHVRTLILNQQFNAHDVSH